MNTDDKAKIIFYDGNCLLCNRSVEFIIRRDPGKQFRFSHLQTDYARRLLKGRSFDKNAIPDSIVLYEKGSLYLKSTAALRIARHLSGLWPILYIFILIPALLRDGLYDFIARHRYRWFGEVKSCRLVDQAMKDRFII